MFAIDGVKLPSNASKAKSGTRADFQRQAAKLEAAAKQMLARHRKNDAPKEVPLGGAPKKWPWAIPVGVKETDMTSMLRGVFFKVKSVRPEPVEGLRQAQPERWVLVQRLLEDDSRGPPQPPPYLPAMKLAARKPKVIAGPSVPPAPG